MRSILIALSLAAAMPAWSAEVPDAACSAQFVKRWNRDKVTMVEDPRQMPARACLMRTDKGDYVCGRDGCVSAYAYTNDD